MNKAQVAVLRTKPETVLADYQRLCELAGMREALDPAATTILKDNISWHLLYPGANTTPWQLEGTILALQQAGLNDIVDVHNKTVVTIADLGDRYNKFGPVLEKYGIPKKYNFKPEDMSWIRYEPRARMAVLPRIFPEGIYIPDYFVGKNIVHVGGPGAGSTFKLINQILVGVNLAGVLEAFVLARKVGLDLNVLFDVLRTSAGNSNMLNYAVPDHIIGRDFEGGFILRLLIKDLDLALQMGKDAHATLFLPAVARQLYEQANLMGYGDKNMTAALLTMEQLQGME